MRSSFMRGVVLAVTVTSTGTGGTVARAQDPGAKIDAAAIYKQRCAMCHGPKGASTLPGMSFADGVWKHGNTVRDLSSVIRNGVPGTAMLSFKSKLKDDEIETLAKFVRAFDPKLPITGPQ